MVQLEALSVEAFPSSEASLHSATTNDVSLGNVVGLAKTYTLVKGVSLFRSLGNGRNIASVFKNRDIVFLACGRFEFISIEIIDILLKAFTDFGKGETFGSLKILNDIFFVLWGHVFLVQVVEKFLRTFIIIFMFIDSVDFYLE